MCACVCARVDICKLYDLFVSEFVFEQNVFSNSDQY